MDADLLLPKSIFATCAGADTDKLGNAAASVAAFVSAAGIPDGAPVAVFLDQTLLPSKELYVCTCDWHIVVDAIATLKVRGAPAIGIAGYLAMMLRAFELCVTLNLQHELDIDAIKVDIEHCAQEVKSTRPTAVSLKLAVDEALDQFNLGIEDGKPIFEIASDLYNLAVSRVEEDEQINRRIGDFGANLLAQESVILTHCNAGSLATAYYGTALGVVYSAAKHGKIKRVYADETRPVCQGSRLTVWELAKAGIPTTLICDDMAASVMSKGYVDAVIVGADRIAANGDVANKIGTLSVAINAHYFGIPFYVAAPFNTIDMNLSEGSEIPIEIRSSKEVCEELIDGVEVYNPAFDVTPASLISGIITEKGVFKPGQFDLPVLAH